MSMRELLLYGSFFLIPFAIQLVLLFITENRFRTLRFAVPILVGAADVIFLLLCFLAVPPGWGLPLVPLVIVICLTLSSLSLAGYGLAWLIYKAGRKAAAGE